MTDLPASLAYARQWALQNRPAWEGAPQHARAPRRPLPQSMRPAWEGATRPYDMPFTAMHDPRTLPMDPLPRLAQRQQQNDLAQFAMQREAGRNEVNTPPGTYFGQDTLEMTGLPSIARGVGHLRDGEPGEALPEMALGGLGVFGMVAGGGARTPRARWPMEAPPRLPEIPPAQNQVLGRPPPRLPPEPQVTPQARSGPDAAQGATPDWLVRNPNEEDLARIAARGDEMKYVMDTDGNVYAFSAADGHHNQAMRALRDSGVNVRPLGAGAEVTDPDAAGFIWRNKDGSFVHEDANMVESGPYAAFQRRVRPQVRSGPDAGPVQGGRGTFEEGRAGQYRADQFFPVNEDQYFGDSHTFPNIATTDVPVRDLIGTQDFVMNDFLSRPATARESVIAHYGDDGKLYIVDGHNRVAAAIARGETTIPARVFPSRAGLDGGPVQAGRFTIRTNPERDHVLEAVDNEGRVVGFLDVELSRNGQYAPGSGPYARAVHVNERSRRQGVATALYQEAERRFGQMVRSDNPSPDAEAFWESYRPSRTGPNAGPPRTPPRPRPPPRRTQ